MSKPAAPDAGSFLRRFHGDGPWMLSAFGRGPAKGGRCEDPARFINGGGYNYYFTPALVREDFDGEKPRKEHITGSRWAWADVDPPKDLNDTALAVWRKSVCDALEYLDPTLIVDSGRGYWVYFELTETVDAERVERINRGLLVLVREQLDGVEADPVAWNCDRVARLPGTINLKTGREAAVVYDSGRRWAPSELPEAEARAERRSEAGALGDAEAVASLDKVFTDTPRGLRCQMLASELRHPDEPPKEGDNSRSAWLYDFCCNGLRDGASPEQLLGILLDKRWGISQAVLREADGSPRANPERYARHTVESALEEVGQEESSQPVLPGPLHAARHFHAGRPHLMHFNREWLDYDGAAYRPLEDATVKAELYAMLESAVEGFTDKGVPRPYKLTRASVGDVLGALQAVAHATQSRWQPPCWMGEAEGPDPRELLACRNGLLHLPTGELLPATPEFFTRNALEFGHDPRAAEPSRWLAFMHELWPDDAESISCLQEILGYLLVPDTSQQKIFLLVGPKRSGKGTIGRVARALIGQHNVCAPTLGSLAGNFGLAPLIGRQMALVSDMRLGPKADKASIAENLLRVSGEDPVSIDRKFLDAWDGTLATRFLLMTNELPSLGDVSGALASRFIPLVIRESFFGREDIGLFTALKAELPGILNWAIAGWRRLSERGHFLLPARSRHQLDRLTVYSSPITGFIQQECVLRAAVTPKDVLYRAYVAWCDETGLQPLEKRAFGKALIAATGQRVDETRPTVHGKRTWCYTGIELVGSEVPQDEIPF